MYAIEQRALVFVCVVAGHCSSGRLTGWMDGKLDGLDGWALMLGPVTTRCSLVGAHAPSPAGLANWTHIPASHAEDMQVLRYQNMQTYGAHW